MRFYGLPYEAVWGMPLKRFWMLHKGIHRLRAEENIWLLDLFTTGNAMNGEAVKEMREELVKQMGEVTREKPEFDRKGFEELRSMRFKRG